MTGKQLHTYPIKLAAPDTEFDAKFVQGMANRMAVSFHKYGPVADGFPTNCNAIESLRLRLAKYAEDGNTEHLIDAANYALIEFMHPAHPHAHFEATDSAGSPGRVRGDGNVNQERNA